MDQFDITPTAGLDVTLPITATGSLTDDFSLEEWGTFLFQLDDTNIFDATLPNAEIDVIIGPQLKSLLLDITDAVETLGTTLSLLDVLNSEILIIGRSLNDTLKRAVRSRLGRVLVVWRRCPHLLERYGAANIGRSHGDGVAQDCA
ncbi:MAG: hypothetical protein R3C28_24840 [Pirellulaceae bacterium]